MGIIDIAQSFHGNDMFASHPDQWIQACIHGQMSNSSGIPNVACLQDNGTGTTATFTASQFRTFQAMLGSNKVQ
jgi:hypothetical protein